MSKLIAVWGSPGAGKTTFALKLTDALYEKYIARIIVILADSDAPMLHIVCGSGKDELRSMGELLASPVITADDVMKHLMTRKNRENVGIMGYVGTDNRNTYPDYDRDKAAELLSRVKDLADIVIVDCTSSLRDALSDAAIRMSDVTYRLAAPNVKSLSFMNSMLPGLIEPEYRVEQMKLVISNTEKNEGAAGEIKEFLGEAVCEIPFSKALRRQMSEGEMLEIVRDKRVRKRITELAEMVREEKREDFNKNA